MPKKLNIIFDAQNDAQKFGVPCGRGCFLRYLMRADFAQRVVVFLPSLESICMASDLVRGLCGVPHAQY